jgi:hypothetical protein
MEHIRLLDWTDCLLRHLCIGITSLFSPALKTFRSLPQTFHLVLSSTGGGESVTQTNYNKADHFEKGNAVSRTALPDLHLPLHHSRLFL